MMDIAIERLSKENFSEFSMDDFKRYQEIKESWMLENGQYVLRPNPHILDWDVEACRSTAREILEGIEDGGFAYGAFSEGKFLGYILIGGKFIGREGDALQLKLFHMTNGLRGQGVGKRLFAAACDEARRRGAKRFYISANASKESQIAYRKMGCVYAREFIDEIYNETPHDVQMEYEL